MPAKKSVTGSELFIVDNSDEDWKVLRYLHDWCQLSKAIDTKWYLYELATEKIVDEPTAIIDLIRSTPQTPRRIQLPQPTLSEIRAKIEKHIKNTYMKAAQAPVGVKPVLKAWMELN